MKETHRDTEDTEKTSVFLPRCLTASVCRISVIAVVICAVASLAYTQGRRALSGVRQVVPYDGRLVFTRIAYNTGLGGFGFNSSAWNHDYPDGRMLALANYNNDIAEYWEWSAEGLYSADWTGDAYRLGVNFFIYALTH
jgi:hypothetical protein